MLKLTTRQQHHYVALQQLRHWVLTTISRYEGAGDSQRCTLLACLPWPGCMLWEAGLARQPYMLPSWLRGFGTDSRASVRRSFPTSFAKSKTVSLPLELVREQSGLVLTGSLQRRRWLRRADAILHREGREQRRAFVIGGFHAKRSTIPGLGRARAPQGMDLRRKLLTPHQQG